MEKLQVTQQELLELYRAGHDEPDMWDGGCFMRKLLFPMKKYLEKRPGRVLDYGCGKANYTKHLGPLQFKHTEWVLYDPGYVKYVDEPQGSFDYIGCADVMEHVLEYEVTLAKISKLLRRGGLVMFSISGHPDKRFFEGGINMHVTQLSLEEWIVLLQKHFPRDKNVILLYNNINYWESWNADLRVQVQRVRKQDGRAGEVERT